MISFNNFILMGFSLRVLFVIIGTFYSFKIIGFKNMSFLSNYIKRSFFSVQKLFYWTIAFLSIFYFEHLVSNAHAISFYEVYDKNWVLTILVSILLFGIVGYALFDAKATIQSAKETKKELSNARLAKNITKAVGFASWFVPGGVFVKGGIFIFSIWGNRKIDNMVKDKVSHTITKAIEAMLLIALVNLSIILISTYLITGKIIFW